MGAFEVIYEEEGRKAGDAVTRLLKAVIVLVRSTAFPLL
ncbi:MAG: hypothetical protein CM1200mP39_30580 [Dehalococcoidia bacterium]|nr:MAG: hypothetical protein CM1200mP39_30580 [Dehalococcoidia bacterium]